jgi:type I restriction enzyme S subunit
LGLEKLSALRKAKEARHNALTHSLVFGTRQLAQFRAGGDAVPYRWSRFHRRGPASLSENWRRRFPGAMSMARTTRFCPARNTMALCGRWNTSRSRSSAPTCLVISAFGVAIGFPSNHIEEGSIGLQNLIDVGVVSPIYTVFRFAADKVDENYAYAVLKTELYRHIEVSTSASATGAAACVGENSRLCHSRCRRWPSRRQSLRCLKPRAAISTRPTAKSPPSRAKRGLMQSC